MSSNLERKPSSAPKGVGGLAPYRDTFLTELGRLGYAAKTIGDYQRAIDEFCAQVEARGLDAGEIGIELPAGQARKGCIARFIEHLIDAGVMAPPSPSLPPAPGSLDELSKAYGDWLHHHRGLSAKTISTRQGVLRRFLTFRFSTAPGDLNTIARDDIVAFLDSPDTATGTVGVDYKAMCLRSLFGFLFSTGRIRHDLALSVPRVARRGSGSLTRHLEPDEIRQLVDAIGSDDGIGRRDHAMLLLMARLGLRAQEVIAIRLEDIDWRAGEILIRGKGGQHERMPLPVDVGEVTAAYLQDGRAGSERHVFVTAKAPHRPFASSLAVRRILRKAFARTGLKPPRGEVRTHLLRHSLAVAMLGKDASLDEVGDVLRHRKRTTTTIYARYDIEALRPLARPWPGPMTSYADLLDRYLAERRRYGGNLASSGLILRPFVSFADAEGDDWITTDLFLRWKGRFGAAGPHTWAIRLSVVRGFAAWLQGIDPRTEVPPRGLIPNRQRRQRPYIYTDDEIARIVTEAARLPSPRGLRGATYATLFGLLAVTGLRIGEAVGLDDGDVDLDTAVLHVRHAKNARWRVVPFTVCAAERLRAYRVVRNRVLGAPPAAFFVGENGRRLSIHMAGYNFTRVRQNIGLGEWRAGTGRNPRLHDLRHTMASMTILDWFRSGRDPDREMYKLSTWLGHTDPAETYWYIEAVPELLQLASERAERSFDDGEGS